MVRFGFELGLGLGQNGVWVDINQRGYWNQPRVGLLLLYLDQLNSITSSFNIYYLYLHYFYSRLVC